MNIKTKLLLGSASAMLLVPAFAFANEGGIKANLGVHLGTRIEGAIQKVEHKGEQGQDKQERNINHATTTAARITTRATAIQTAADTMLSFNTRIGALIASSSTSGQAALQTQFTAFQTAAANAKAKAAIAITGAAQVNATNSTSTNATLLAQAKVDLSAASGFLHDAQKALFSVLRSLWQ